MKTNSICSQLEMKCALEVFGAVCVAVDMWLCGSLCVQSCRVFVTRHVGVGVTMRDAADVEVGVWVNVGLGL